MIEIIPAIDLIDGKCVRLSQGDYLRRTVYDASPVDMVKRYIDAGLHRIHVVDLDGAKSTHPANLDVLEQLAKVEGACIEWGGGIKSDDALGAVFDAGAAYAVVGSIAASQPELFDNWLRTYGADRMVLGADIKDGKVAVKGWLEQSSLTVEALIERFLPQGLNQVICTDITKDGMLQGPSFELYTHLSKTFPGVSFTVSGGISSIDDITALARAGLPRVIVGKAIYEGRITLSDLTRLVC